MNLDKLFEWTIIVVIGFAVTGNLDKLTYWVYHAQTKVIYESRASTCENPSIFKGPRQVPKCPLAPSINLFNKSNAFHRSPFQLIDGGILPF